MGVGEYVLPHIFPHVSRVRARSLHAGAVPKEHASLGFREAIKGT